MVKEGRVEQVAVQSMNSVVTEGLAVLVVEVEWEARVERVARAAPAARAKAEASTPAPGTLLLTHPSPARLSPLTARSAVRAELLGLAPKEEKEALEGRADTAARLVSVRSTQDSLDSVAMAVATTPAVVVAMAG